MKKSRISLILFWIGIFIILISNISIIKYRNSQNILTHIFFIFIALSIIITGWTLRNDSETYDDLSKVYDYRLKSGNEESEYSQYPGLGWVL